jgi:hypothetical protein
MIPTLSEGYRNFQTFQTTNPLLARFFLSLQIFFQSITRRFALCSKLKKRHLLLVNEMDMFHPLLSGPKQNCIIGYPLDLPKKEDVYVYHI